MQYFAQGMTAFIITVMLKKHFARPRPDFKNKPLRIKNLRGKEIDCSWPSGDTAQGGIFAFFIILNMPYIVIMIPYGHWLMAIWTFHVAFARVFFHCHYIGDTIGGVCIAGSAALLNTYITRILV